MKLVMTLLVRDEQDILRRNLDFHLSNGVDHFILMDNRSNDETAAIAQSYERAGRLQYIEQTHDDFAQGRWVTEMARRAVVQLGADWVINSDADEFWMPHTGSLKDALASLDAKVVAATAQRTNFVARTENGEPFWRRMTVREAVSLNALGDPLPGKSAHRGRIDIVVGQGNHEVFIGGQLAPRAPAPITILHFPVRSREQFRNKIEKGGAAYARNRDLPAGDGLAWRRLYERQLAGEFDAVYDQLEMSNERVAAGLASGEFIADRRLLDASAPRV
jgi:hypothetical protein